MTAPNRVESRPIRVGISSCLLGQRVRFDGGHKQDRYLTDTLGPYFLWTAVCPEVELGLGTPRETIRLVRLDNEVRLVSPHAGRDLTDSMRRYAKRRVAELQQQDLSGYVLKKALPVAGWSGSKSIRRRASRARRAGDCSPKR